MAKHSGKITKRVIDSWQSCDGDPILWDGKLAGFGVKANKDETKTFIIDYRDKYNVKRRFTLGKLSDKLTAQQAREKADELLARIRLEGFNPSEDRAETKAELTVNELLDLYLASAKFAELAETTRYTHAGRIKRHLRPTLGKLRLEQVGKEKVRRAYADIRDGKTSVVEKTKARGKALVRGGPGTARMAIRLLRAIFNWAIEEGMATSNPVQGIDIGRDKTRKLILETAEHYALLFNALDKLQTERRIPDAAADAIRVLAFTGARRNEIAALRWRYVDLDRGIVTLPASAHKTGHETNEDKEIGLNAAARAIIDGRPKGEPGDYVFPATRGDAPICLSSKLWGVIQKEAGLPRGLTNHALRHSLGTLMAVRGAEAAQIAATLGHRQLSTAQGYIHIARAAKAELSEKFTAEISAVFSGAPKAEVVDIKRGAK